MTKPNWAISPFDFDPSNPHNEHRRSSSVQLSVDPRASQSDQMRQIFANLVPEVEVEDASTDLLSHPKNLIRVHSYSRIMHAHTKFQLDSHSQNKPFNSLPSYQRTMHAFTLNQLNSQHPVQLQLPQLRRSSSTRSETSSEAMAAQQAAILPSPVYADLNQLTIDEAPVPPCNSPCPESGRRGGSACVRGRGMKPRSTTMPIPRDFAVAARDRESVGAI